jgi:ferrous iron transport protein B
MQKRRIALVGNPNSGKTTLFNALTGANQQVGNWPGVTVERKEGEFSHAGNNFTIVDLPGIYTMTVSSEASMDEVIARDYIFDEKPDLVINIVDASNLERNLYLSIQLIEMRVPLLIVLNKTDHAIKEGRKIDAKSLSKRLGCPVIPISARSGEGIGSLKKQLDQNISEPTLKLSYASVIEETIADLALDVEGINPRWLAVKLLEDDEAARSLVNAATIKRVEQKQREIEQRLEEEADILLADARYGVANALVRETVVHTDKLSQSATRKIDMVVLNRVLGLPIFLGIMYLMFLFTITFASGFIDFFDIFAGTLLVEGGAALFSYFSAPDWLIAIVPKGIGAGIQTVATFIPVIGFLFLFLTFLEDSGYMARAAFVMDRLMRAIGLPGKSFVPMILGFGCTVPAVMAARTMESHRDRVITIMMAPFMSCGARLPVYALFAAAFFPVNGQNIVFLLYLMGIGAAVLTGLMLKSTVLRGNVTPFVMELPDYHIPTLRAVLLRTWDRLRAFIVDAGQIIVIIVAILAFFNSIGTDGSFGNDDSDKSVLAAVGKAITPVFEPMGVTEDNWPATVGLFTGIFAKEAVVGTLDSLYNALAEQEAANSGQEQAADFDFWGGMAEAFSSVPANLKAATSSFTASLGLEIGDISSLDAAASEQDVNVGTFGAMVKRFDGQLGAFAYLVAILLYMPCVAAISAIFREVGTLWGTFAALWTTFLGYGGAVAVYQVGSFFEHPQTSGLWLAGLAATLGAIITTMWIYGNSSRQHVVVR